MTPEQLAANGTEDGHQAALFCWAQKNASVYPGIEKMFAIPNGGARDSRTGARLKMTGVKPGVPDIFLPVPKGRFAGLFIEMKKPKDSTAKVRAGTVRKEQVEYIEFLRSMHYCVAVCYTWETATETIQHYYMGLT